MNSGLPTTPPPPASTELLVRMRQVGKRFGPVAVLRQVDLDLYAGEVLILAGENGAGKSTLMKILGGVYSEYEGTVEMGGRTVKPRSPLEASALGVAVIYQELSLVPSMTVADNIFLGRMRARAGWVNDRAQRAEAQKLLNQLGIPIDVRQRVEELPIAQQQLTEIAKALSQSTRVLVMDEPTSALSAPEVERLFALVRDLQRRGCGIIYITHKMEEIHRLGTRIMVLRDGAHVGTAPATELPPARLVQWMVGRELGEQFPRHTPKLGPVRLELDQVNVASARRGGAPLVNAISLSVRAGEIVGVAGLQGSGASELFLGLFGAFGQRLTGTIRLNGTPVHLHSPREAIRQGIALLTNDRKATGLVLSMSVVANTTLAGLPRLSRAGWRSPRQERAITARLAETLGLKAASLEVEVGWLSGGNQQKVALAKWLQTEPQMLLLDEPTRGIDIGAKRDIYTLIHQLTEQGIAVLLITSELPELLALADRIVVLHRGRLTASFDRANATPEGILQAAMGTVHSSVVQPPEPATPRD